MVEEKYRVYLAFALTIGAGLSTCIGGLVPFYPKLISLAKPSRIGLALGLSAGVMIFISLVEIFQESVESFEKGFGKNQTSICGNLTDHCRNLTVSCGNLQDICENLNRKCINLTTTEEGNGDCDKICKGHSVTSTTICFLIGAGMIFLLDFIVHKISPDTNHDLDVEEMNALHQSPSQIDPEHLELQNLPNEQQIRKNEATQRALKRTGILTAVAIAIHNLPEGIATFMGAMKDTKLGVQLAIGIAIHNIPEGIAVATPVFYATGSKWKALFYTFISALAEPLGGFLSWLIIHVGLKQFINKNGGLNPFINGIMFGLVAGMMVTISIKELIPTAIRYCPSKDQVSISIFIGMIIMALSLILFAYAGV